MIYAFLLRYYQGALAIMHPPLYNAGLTAMKRLEDWSVGNDSKMREALTYWSTVYTNVSTIVNWCSPLHRDPQSWPDWFDLLVSVGDYKNC